MTVGLSNPQINGPRIISTLLNISLPLSASVTQLMSVMTRQHVCSHIYQQWSDDELSTVHDSLTDLSNGVYDMLVSVCRWHNSQLFQFIKILRNFTLHRLQRQPATISFTFHSGTFTTSILQRMTHCSTQTVMTATVKCSVFTGCWQPLTAADTQTMTATVKRSV